MTDARVLNGFKTKGSSASIVSPQEFSGSNTLQQYDQGVYINDINQLFGSAVIKMRPNNDFLKLKNGRAYLLTEGFFDDTESPVSLGSAGVGSGSFVTLSSNKSDYNSSAGGKGSSFTVAPSHFNPDYDFGQPDFFQDGSPYSEKDNAQDPLWVISINPIDLPSLISDVMVNSTELISKDGVIDPFGVRDEIDRSFTEIPFRFKGFRCDLVNDNVYRRSTLIVDEIPTAASRVKPPSPDKINTFSTDPFLDAGDDLTQDDLAFFEEIVPINASGYVLEETSTTSPYVDSSDGVLTSELVSTEADSFMRDFVALLTGSQSLPTHTHLSRNHISPSHGYVYDNCVLGIDSLAFGGLLRR